MKTIKIDKRAFVTSTWFEHATFWSGVRRATIALRSHIGYSQDYLLDSTCISIHIAVNYSKESYLTFFDFPIKIVTQIWYENYTYHKIHVLKSIYYSWMETVTAAESTGNSQSHAFISCSFIILLCRCLNLSERYCSYEARRAILKSKCTGSLTTSL